MELSEERKRQIRADEEAKFRAEQDAEKQYREEVRRELEGKQQAEAEQQFREEVRAELAETAPAPSAEPAPTPPPAPVAPPASVPVTPRKRGSPWFPKRVIAGALVLGGLACAGLAFSRGFVLPFTGAPSEIVLEAEATGELEALDEPAPGEPAPSDAAPAGAEAGASDSTAGGRDETAVPTGSPAAGGKRAVLKATGTSIEVPAGWHVEPGEFEDVLEIRWGDPRIVPGPEEPVAYVLLQTADLRRGEDLEDFGERKTKEFLASAAPDQKIALEREEVIGNFHGVTAVSIDIVSGGYAPHRMRNLYWVKDGKGYVLTCYATAGSFEDREPAFDRMLESIRL